MRRLLDILGLMLIAMLAITALFAALAALKLIGWEIVGLLLGILAGILIFTGSAGMFFIPLLLPLITRLRKHRAAAVLNYLEQAIRLNLPLPGMLGAAARSERGALGRRLDALSDRLESGWPLREALQAGVPEVAPRTAATLGAAERIGRLPQVLHRLVQRERATSGLRTINPSIGGGYPTFVLIVMAVILTGIMVLIVPKFEKIFEDYDTQLPAVTQSVFTFGRWVGGHGYPSQEIPGAVWIALGVWGVVGLWLLWQFPFGQRWMSGVADRLPVAGTMARDRALGDACHLIAEGLRAGVPLPAALHEAEESTLGLPLQRRFRAWSALTANGQPMSAAARAAGMPELLSEMLATAEQTGAAEDTFDFLARYYAGRFSRLRAVLRGASMPAAVILLAIVVGWIVVGIFAPLVKLILNLTW